MTNLDRPTEFIAAVPSGLPRVNAMLCPMCGCSLTHIDTVMVAPPSDYPDAIMVTSFGGDETEAPDVFLERIDNPTQQTSGQTIILSGYCDLGCTFGFGFEQYQSTTLLVKTGEISDEALSYLATLDGQTPLDIPPPLQ